MTKRRRWHHNPQSVTLIPRRVPSKHRGVYTFDGQTVVTPTTDRPSCCYLSEW